jgi:O-methyltransferase involved in polyketide biosynthesis
MDMMELSEVSKTSILTLICRAVGAKKKAYSFNDQKALELYDLVYDCSTKSERQWMNRVKKKYRRLSRKSVKVICNRAVTFDKITNEFVESNPSGTIINLGCGFDTRFWRILRGNYRYIELDLPEVMRLKTRILESKIDYECLGISVLDTSWIDQVTKNGNENFLIIAEGLFMYLPKEEVVKLIQVMAGRFRNSLLVFDSVHEKYTEGIWKWFTNWNWRMVLGIDINYTYGIKNPSEIEDYSKGLKITHSKKHHGHLISVCINNKHD